jgi:hypothetical protein
VDWTELNMLAARLNDAVSRDAFLGLGPITVKNGRRPIDRNVLAHIVLADIDHVRDWEQTHPAELSSKARREDLGCWVRSLLGLVKEDQAASASPRRSRKG